MHAGAHLSLLGQHVACLPDFKWDLDSGWSYCGWKSCTDFMHQDTVLEFTVGFWDVGQVSRASGNCWSFSGRVTGTTDLDFMGARSRTGRMTVVKSPSKP